MNGSWGMEMEKDGTRVIYGRRVGDTKRLEPLHILLVEDTTGDVLMAVSALKKTQISHKIDTLKTGQQVLPYLEGLQFRKERLPDVILLDLGMPGVNGFDVLEMIAAAAPEFRAIPIIVLTGYRNAISSDHQHIEGVSGLTKLKIVGYIEKPCKSDALSKLLQEL